METKIVLLNGPAGCGKDTLADYLVSKHGAIKQQFKDALFEATCEYYGVSIEFFMAQYSRTLKEQPLDALRGKSPRDALIHVSEKVYKPKYGKDYFGVQAANKVVEGKLNVFADSGFAEELQPIREKFGDESLKLIQIHRDGCDFSKDSRSFLHTRYRAFVSLGNPELALKSDKDGNPVKKDKSILLEDMHFVTLLIENNGSLSDLYDVAVNFINPEP